MEDWKVETTAEFLDWFSSLSHAEAEDVMSVVDLLRVLGPELSMPHSSRLMRARHRHMRELRIQHAGRPYRVLYIFDPRRAAVLLLGGDKTGKKRWYEQNVPRADRLYDEYLQELKRGGLI